MDSAGEGCSSEILTCMVLAVEQAKCALDCLEVPIGCVIIEDGKVIASGRNQTTETRDLRSLTGSSSPEQTIKPVISHSTFYVA